MVNPLKTQWLNQYAIICSVFLCGMLAHRGMRMLQETFSPRPVEHTDDNAKTYYLNQFSDVANQKAAASVLSKATHCYVFDGGSYSGSRWFWTCTLDSEQSCFDLLRQTPFRANVPVRPLELSDMAGYSQDKLLQGIVGPLQFQSINGPASSYWFPQLVERGCYFLMTDGNRYYMFLIDLDRCRVYECYHS